MIKTFLMKTLTMGLLVVGSSCIEVNAQQTASGRELKIVSFAEADKSDFDVTTPSNFSGKLSISECLRPFPVKYAQRCSFQYPCPLPHYASG